LAVARELVVYLKRSGGQEQYSEPLQFQAESVSRFTELTTWIPTHLNEDLSVEVLAGEHVFARDTSVDGSRPTLAQVPRTLSKDCGSMRRVVGFLTKTIVSEMLAYL